MKKCFGDFKRSLNSRAERKCVQCSTYDECISKTWKSHIKPVGRPKGKS